MSADSNQVSSRRKASLHTLGCRLNQYETKLMRDKLAQGGIAGSVGVVEKVQLERREDLELLKKLKKEQKRL